MEKVTEKKNIFTLWIFWRYGNIFKEMFLRWKNIFLFIANYFSFSVLLKTYFSPWKRQAWSYGRGFSVERYFEAFVSNSFSRIIGAIIRTPIIIFGVFCEVLVIVAGVAVFLFWALMPFLIIIGLVTTIYGIF